MQDATKELLRTRTTLVRRLKNWEDQASWQEFFNTYRKLIFGVAIKSRLTESEAQEVVQETMIAVARHMPDFEYDRSQGSFKGWLLKVTRWRIADQFRKRDPACGYFLPSGDSAIVPLDGIPDATHLDLEALWETEWKKSLLEAAMAITKRQLPPQQYQLYDVYVNKRWSPDKIAEKFRVSVGQVYLAKHRVTAMVKKEVARLIKATA